jgi:hypothetical protein
MTTLNLADIDFDKDNLDENGKKQLASLQFVDAKLRLLESEMAVYKTAYETYLNLFVETIEKSKL